MKNYEPGVDFNGKDEEVECYHDYNGFCMISPCYGQCPFEGDEKLDCEDYEEA